MCQIFFEKFILKRIHELEIINGVFAGGKQQYSFMKNNSMVTAGLILQSLIARALDDDCYVALAGIDLSSTLLNIHVLPPKRPRKLFSITCMYTLCSDLCFYS